MRTKEDLISICKEQLDILRSHCDNYDRGNIHFAGPITNVLRLLFKSKKQTISLIDQLGVTGPFLIDSRSSMEESEAVYTPMIRIIVSGNVIDGRQLVVRGKNHYAARLKAAGSKCEWPKVPFEDWWNQTVLRMGDKTLSRSTLVLTLAEKDGGTHVDPKIEPTYGHLKKKNSVGSDVFICGELLALDNSPVHPTVRQIAFETLEVISK